MKHIIFTICSNNYFAQAVVLGHSLVSSNPQCEFYVCVTDRNSNEIDYSAVQNVVFVEDLQITALEYMIQRYSIIELNTAIKPYMFSYLLQVEKGCDMVTYLDPDIYVYRSLDLIEDLIKEYDFILTPHITSPYPLDNRIPAEEDILNTGMYNLGYISIKNNVAGRKMISWWEERLKDKANVDFLAGHFTDQIWINFVPLYFKKVFVLYDLGYNVAYWNLHERSLIQKNGVCTVFNQKECNPLIFFHFSGYNPMRPDVFSKYQTRLQLNDNSELRKLCDDYGRLLLQSNYELYSQVECVYQRIHTQYLLDIRTTQLNRLSGFQRKCRAVLLQLRNCINQQIDRIERIMNDETK